MAVFRVQEVAAMLSDGASTCTTPASLTLERGKSYEYAVTYRSPSGTRYHVADKLKVTANWKGISSRQVVLEPALITPATFEQALKDSAVGDVLEFGEGEFCFKEIIVSRDLTLRGRGAGKTVIRVEFRFTIEASSVAIENCSLESKGDNAIQVAGVGGKVLLSNCTCKTLSNDTCDHAVWLGDGCSGSIRNCELNGVQISGRCVCEIADSRVIGANQWGVCCGEDSSLRMTSTVAANCKNYGIVLFDRAKCELNDCKLYFFR